MARIVKYLRHFNIQVLIALVAAILCAYVDFIPRLVIHYAVEFVIRIHQIPIIPYIIVSLIVGLGSINKADIIIYAKRLALFTFLLWSVSLVMLSVFAYAYKPLNHNVNIKHIIDHLGLTGHIAMSYSSELSGFLGGMLIPALAVTVIALSVSLIFIDQRDKVIAPLNVVREMFEYLFDWFLTMLPISIFVLLLHALNVFNIDKLMLLSHHFLAVIIFSIIFILLVFPFVLKILRGLTYGEVLKAAMPCLWLTVLAGDCVLALPIVIRSIKTLLHKQGVRYADYTVGFMVPIAFSLPLVGSIGNLLFIHLVSVFYGIEFNLINQAKLMLLGTISMFAEPLIAVPLMLEQFNMPHDAVPLFMLVSTFTDLLFDTLETFSMIVLVYLVLSPSNTKQSVWVIRSRFVIMLVLCIFISLPAILYLRSLSAIEHLWQHHPGISIRDKVHSHNLPGNVFEKIKKTGVIDVGIGKGMYPSCYDEYGHVNGFEIDLVRRLARDLHVKLRFHSLSDESDLHTGKVDLNICSGTISNKIPKGVLLSQPIVEGKFVHVRDKSVQVSRKSQHVSDNKELNSFIHKQHSSRAVMADITARAVIRQSDKYLIDSPKSKRYIVTWSVDPSAHVLIDFINHWLTALKSSDDYGRLREHWLDD